MQIPAMSMGDSFGEYQLIRKLGEGGIGIVWLAYDPRLNRKVAIKTLRPEFETNSILTRRFLREAKATAQLSHPNIVTIYHADESPTGQIYIVMEYLDAGSLADIVKATVIIPWREACRFAAQAACGLYMAHQAGIIHRDVKPANLMRSTIGTVKVVDFGLAHAESIEPELTHSGVFLGSPSYVSPEQSWGVTPTPASDIYALGITLFVLLTGKLPFTGDEKSVIIEHHRRTPFPDVRALAPNTPRPLAEFLQKMAAKKPEHRPASMKEVEATLLAIMNHEQGARQPDENSPSNPAQNVSSTPIPASINQKKTTFPSAQQSTPNHVTPNNMWKARKRGPTESLSSADMARLRDLSRQVEQSRASGDSAAEMNGWRELFEEYTRIGREDDARLAARRAIMLYTQLHRPGIN